MSPWVALGVLLAWLGSLTAVGYWQNHQGRIDEKVVWEKRYNEEVTQAADQLKQLEDTYRLKEQDWNYKLNTVSVTYQRKLDDANKKFAVTSTNIDNGTIRLLDTNATSVCSGKGTTTEVASSTSGSNAASGCELSTKASRDLWKLAEQADATAERLAACQAIITLDRQ